MAQKEFNKFGHPGKYPNSITVTSGEAWFTGSDYGTAAVIRGNGAEGTLHLSKGGTIDLTDLDAGVIHELSIEHVTGVVSGSLYALKRG